MTTFGRPSFLRLSGISVDISDLFTFLGCAGNLNRNLSKPPPESPILYSMSLRSGRAPVSAIIHVPVIISAVQRKSPRVAYIGFNDRLKAFCGHFATQ